MSVRESPSSDAIGDLLRRIDKLEAALADAVEALEHANLHPLRWRVETIAPGPPPVYRVSLVNPASGATIVLGDL